MKAHLFVAALLVNLPLVLPAGAEDLEHSYRATDTTFSIIAVDKETGQLGLGVQSKALSIGNRVVTGKGGVAIVAHQSSSNPMYGVMVIDAIERGMTPQQALDFTLRADAQPDRRQVAVIDIQGRSATWTSPTITDWKGHLCKETFCVQGNTLTGGNVIEDIAKAYESAKGPLAERLLTALDAGQAAGGDRRGTQAAALMVVQPLVRANFDDKLVDIRVDDNKAPLVELRRILGVLRAQEAMDEVDSLIKKNDLNGAMKVSQNALTMAPGYDNALIAIADINLRMGKKTESLSAVKQAIESNPALKKQFPRNKAFTGLYADPEFLQLTK
jgi:uncharacterized Ntn-hydrolase superfamily protein